MLPNVVDSKDETRLSRWYTYEHHTATLACYSPRYLRDRYARTATASAPPLRRSMRVRTARLRTFADEHHTDGTRTQRRTYGATIEAHKKKNARAQEAERTALLLVRKRSA